MSRLRKPCNHRVRYYVGDRKLNAAPKPPVVVQVYWCRTCGAVTFAGGWLYPNRSEKP